MSQTAQTKFYEFRQNNSGGSFDTDDERGIGVHVWVEALDARDAEARAERIGIYFDGCDDGRDCSCCGDRWSRLWAESGRSEPVVKGEWDFNWSDVIYVHALDGSFRRISKPAP